ncbi:chemotaxis protein CheW [Massilia sp. X63]|jgi:purine-binding chemotaxis protein CheW|uniref:chemotaxis protein CheW n=1 Tax=Massilia sp. X63 TaxID=3237285 RepID=UPI0034DD8741
MDSTAAQDRKTEVLAFKLGSEEYGIDILKVQEIRGYERVTRLASSPAFVKGVINLRGVIVPIFDMRIRFGLGTPSYDELTVVIILHLGHRIMGMVVDSVSDVISLSPEQIKPPPPGAHLHGEHLTGIATVDQRMLILVDIDALMSSSQEFSSDTSAPASPAAGDNREHATALTSS